MRWNLIRLARWSTVLALTALCTLGVSYRRPPLARLSTAVEEFGSRPTEARISSFSYVPFVRTRGADAADTNFALNGAAVEILLEQNDGHTRGVAQLVSRRFVSAVNELDSVAHQSNDPAVWSDLSAALYERGRKDDSPEDLTAAAGAAAQALDLDPTFAPATFNLAIELDALSLTPLAENAYRDYLAVDSSSGWAQEANRRLQALPKITAAEEWDNSRKTLEQGCLAGNTEAVDRIVQRFPEHARRWGEGFYLGNWAARLLQSQSATNDLRFARCIGNSLQRLSEEHLLADSVAGIDAANADQKTRLASALVAYIEGRKTYSAQQLLKADAHFTTGVHLFQREASPLQLLAGTYRAGVLSDKGDATAAIAMLDEIDGKRSHRYKALQADILAARGMALARLGHMYEAVDSTRQALRRYEALREADNSTRLSISLIAGLTKLGQQDEAWRMRRQAFAAASASGNRHILQQALNNLVFDEFIERHWHVVSAFGDKTARIAPPASESRAMAFMVAAYARAMSANRTGSFIAAHDAARSIPDAPTREVAEDAIRFNEASLLTPTEPGRAIQLFDATIVYRAAKFPYRLAAAYAARARAWQILGDGAAADADFDRAIAELERQRDAPPAHYLAIDSYIGDDSRIYDDALDLAASRREYERVFWLSEQTRARAIREHSGIQSAPLIPLQQLPARLEDGIAVLSFTTLAQKTVVTVATRRGVQNTQVSIGRMDTAKVVSEFVSTFVNHDEKTYDSVSRALHDAFLAPLRTEIEGFGTLVIVVSNDDLSRLPFGALTDSTTGRRVIEDHAVIMAPSVATFIAHHAEKSSPRRDRLLAVGDPAFDTNRFNTLPRLTWARGEVEAIAKWYPSSEVLVDSEATRASVLKLLPDVDVVHLATHALSGRSSATSLLALAPSANDSGLLYVRDIAALHLPRRPIIVLAGCGTAVTVKGPGSVRSLAAAFLAAGAEGVVGTLWDLSDEADRALMTGLHKQIRDGVPLGAALRNEQLRLLHTHGVGEWAGFQVYGYE